LYPADLVSTTPREARPPMGTSVCLRVFVLICPVPSVPSVSVLSVTSDSQNPNRM